MELNDTYSIHFIVNAWMEYSSEEACRARIEKSLQFSEEYGILEIDLDDLATLRKQVLDRNFHSNPGLIHYSNRSQAKNIPPKPRKGRFSSLVKFFRKLCCTSKSSDSVYERN